MRKIVLKFDIRPRFDGNLLGTGFRLIGGINRINPRDDIPAAGVFLNINDTYNSIINFQNFDLKIDKKIDCAEGDHW